MELHQKLAIQRVRTKSGLKLDFVIMRLVEQLNASFLNKNNFKKNRDF